MSFETPPVGRDPKVLRVGPSFDQKKEAAEVNISPVPQESGSSEAIFGRFALNRNLIQLRSGLTGLKDKVAKHINPYIPSPIVVANSLRGVGLAGLALGHNLIMDVTSSMLVKNLETDVSTIGASAVLLTTSGYQFAVHTFGMIKSLKELYDIRKEMNAIHERSDIEYSKDDLEKLRDLTAKKYELRSKISSFFIADAPKLLLDLAGASLIMTVSVGKLAGKIGSASVPVLHTVLHALSYAGAGLGIILGVYGIQKSIRGLYGVWKEHTSLNERVLESDERFKNLTGLSDEEKNILKSFEEVRLKQDLIKNNKEFSQHVFGLCLSSMAIASASLGLASAFTSGGALVGLSVLGLVLAGISIGVQVTSHLRQKKLSKEIAAQKELLGAKLPDLQPQVFVDSLVKKVRNMDEDAITAFAAYLGVDKDKLQKNPEAVLSLIYKEITT